MKSIKPSNENQLEKMDLDFFLISVKNLYCSDYSEVSYITKSLMMQSLSIGLEGGAKWLANKVKGI